MKTLTFSIGILLAIGIHVQADGSIISESPVVKERGLHHTVNESVRVIEKAGQQQSITNRYTTLATGMHRSVNGELVAADPVIELHPDGAIADKTQHKVKFLANINNWEGAIDLETPDGHRFLSRPLGISYLDGENSVLIAELKDSVGTLLPPNRVTFESAFTDFRADLEYNNFLAGLQQNLIFRERPPQPSEFGLNNETAYIELLTEFFESPEPIKTTQVRNGVENDRQLDFGSMKIGVGKSFVIGEEKRACLVEKQWVRINQRNFLIERVPYAKIAPLLNTLPLPEQVNNAKLDKIRRIASKKRLLPERQLAQLETAPRMQIASAAIEQKGFVIDYSLIIGELTNYVFQADETYFVTNQVSLYGTTVFEGGTVVKFRGGSLLLDGDISCQTDAYRPAVFTRWDDDSVGTSVSGGTGSAGASAAIGLHSSNHATLKHLRISYANMGMEINANATISDCQFVNCDFGLYLGGGELRLRNNLFYQCTTALGGIEANIHGEHLTVNRSLDLAYEEFDLQVRLTNTLLVAVTNLGLTDINATNSNFLWFTNDPGIFQTVGAGSHYLAEASPYRNAGTTNLTPEMLAILPKRTSYPPVVLTSNITVNTTLSPVVERDSNVPDLGYLYAPLDYVLGDLRVNGATVNVTDGAAIGFYARSNSWGGCTLECGATFNSLGRPENLNRLVWFNTVQEQSDSAWNVVPGWALPDIFAYDNYSCAGVTLDCRFTQFSRLADSGSHIGQGDVGWGGNIRLRDCAFSGGAVYLYAQGGINGQVNASMTNSLLLRSFLYCLMDETMQVAAVNNLFYGGAIYLDGYSVSGTQFAELTFKDNFFFTNTITSNGVMTQIHSHNAYVTNHNRLGTLATGDVILTNVPSFESGALGDFYLPTNSLLINAGSQNATNATLYHYTTTTNNFKETNSIVDIGFHYVAVDSNGLPFDDDSDGSPDYEEDANGNGVVDSGETDWEDPEDLGLRVLITRPRQGSNLP